MVLEIASDIVSREILLCLITQYISFKELEAPATTNSISQILNDVVNSFYNRTFYDIFLHFIHLFVIFTVESKSSSLFLKR